MRRITQTLDDITSKLIDIESGWQDATSIKIESELKYLDSELRKGKRFDQDLVKELLNRDFKTYLTIFRLILEMSKDELEANLRSSITGGIGIKSFNNNPIPFLDFFREKNLQQILTSYLHKNWTWDNIIIERLKYGRGSAIKGQKRGRYVEDETEKIIKKVFGIKYDSRCNFTGLHGNVAKAEFAIPNKNDPSIIFEAKAYGATGSKQTDVIGDIDKIIKVKKPYTDFLFITDGRMWMQRISDLRKIIEFQNNGDIRKIYTVTMFTELEKDLISLKSHHSL